MWTILVKCLWVQLIYLLILWTSNMSKLSHVHAYANLKNLTRRNLTTVKFTSLALNNIIAIKLSYSTMIEWKPQVAMAFNSSTIVQTSNISGSYMPHTGWHLTAQSCPSWSARPVTPRLKSLSTSFIRCPGEEEYGWDEEESSGCYL